MASSTDYAKLHTLSYNNFPFLKSALTINAALYDAKPLVQTDQIVELTDPAASNAQEQKHIKLKAIIIQNIPKTTANKLVLKLVELAHEQIVQAIESQISNEIPPEPQFSKSRS
eukprot:gb/GEZJ01001730.1/.p3 GENE.gb/GEZJ01001730.1/~~gb/GEZJ01001730.1/.p3  ORF type:complete len:114 (+),score=27.70 gb/GEZJ01001730.1/:133-474(+)